MTIILCRADEKFQAKLKNGLRDIFFTGGNSACRGHARQHYALYAKKCAEANIPESEHAVPRKILRDRQATAAAAEEKDLKAGKLTFAVAPKTQGPKEFSKGNILEHTAKYIICTDQVSPYLRNYPVNSYLYFTLVVCHGQ